MRLGITDLVVICLAGDYCVKFSVLDALSLGYKVTILRKGVFYVDPSKQAEVEKEVEAAGGFYIDSL